MTIRQKVVSVTLILIFLTIGVTSGTYYFWYLQHPHAQSMPAVGKDWVMLAIGVTIVMGAIGTAAAFVLSSHLARPIAIMVETANAIANGDFDREIVIRRQDETGQLIEAFRRMKDSIDAVLEEMTGLMLAIQDGKLDFRGNAEDFSGDWQELITSVNTVIDAFVEPFTVTTAYLDRISKGDIPDRVIEEYQGDFNRMIKNLNMFIDAMNEITWVAVMIAAGNLDVDVKERSEQDRLMKALNTMINQLNTIMRETNGLIQAVQEGDLDIRINTETFTGGWRNLVIGMNNILDAFVGPFTTASTYIDRIAKGDIPGKIDEEYQGDFNTLKQNLNLLIDAMNDIALVADEMAHGNLTVEVNERSAQDTLMQALNMMIQRLQDVVADVKATADDSAKYAEEVGEVVTEMVVAIQQISGRIVTIEDIATQTRMLSLNATIEAARVQEHGRAFSVVAAEVRQLADTTKKAAEEINQLATSSLDISKKIGEMFTILVPNIHKTAELVQKISVASGEIFTDEPLPLLHFP